MGYATRAVKGISWVGAFRLSTRFVTLLRTAILARILSPAQFGVFGVATLVLGLVEMLTETGINIFLVQENERIEKYVNTAWIVSILRGILISVVIIITAPIVSGFFHRPDAYQLLLLISIVPCVRGFINPSVITYQKDLQFHKEFWFRSFIFFIDSMTAIIFAFITRSPISLIYGFIIGALAEVVLSFLVVKPTPKFAFEMQKVKEVIHRGKWMTLAGVFNYLFYNGDNIVVGRVLGASPLGLYQMAYRISTIPITEVADVVSRVTFPVYVKIAGDASRLKKAFLKTILAIVGLTVPFGLLLFIFTEPLVLLLLGENWLQIVPVLRVLAIFGVVRAISSSASALFLSVRKQEYVTIVTLFAILGLAVAIFPMVSRYGILGAGLAALIGSFVALPAICYYTWRVFRDLKI